MSTEMADLGEIEDALEILVSSGTKKENIPIVSLYFAYIRYRKWSGPLD